MIIIYTPYPSERIKYVLNYIFGRQLGLEWQLTNDANYRDISSKLIVNYSEMTIEGSLHIIPEGLLTEKGLRAREIDVTTSSERKVIFRNGGAMGFDIFSAVFYCLSRYEEYTAKDFDVHGRFKHTDSFLWKNQCLLSPLVDLWIAYFKELLTRDHGYQSSDFGQQVFSVLPTIDIDSAFTYRGRDFVRQVLGYAKSIAELNFIEAFKRFNVTVLGEQDPNDNFEYQMKMLQPYKGKACYFIQVGNYGKYDKNISASNRDFRNIIKDIVANGHHVGLHPSYQSESDREIIEKERQTLEDIVEQPVLYTRQHFLRFRLPTTYRVLNELGFQKEFSMGYSEVAGFRAATGKPFFWYDLEREESTSLEIVPFCVMDVAFKQFARVSCREAIDRSSELKDKMRVLKGNFSFVFHNESLSGHRGWEGWNGVFQAWLEQ